MRPANIQISLCIRAIWSESSLDAFWTDKDANFHHVDNEDSDKTVRVRRLIRVFVVRKYVEGTFFYVDAHHENMPI